MKKISFLVKFLIVLTVLSVGILYLLTRHYERLIATPVKKYFVNYVIDDLVTELTKVEPGTEKEKLSVELKKFSEEVLSQDIIRLKPLEGVAKTIGEALADSAVNEQELNKILQQFNKYKNERHQKN